MKEVPAISLVLSFQKDRVNFISFVVRKQANFFFKKSEKILNYISSKKFFKIIT